MWKIIAALVLLAGPAFGGFLSGNEILDECKSEFKEYCAGYISAAADMVETMSWEVDMSPPFCLPNGVTIGQLRDTFVNYLEENPSQRHYTASSLYVTAMRKRFPASDPTQPSNAIDELETMYLEKKVADLEHRLPEMKAERDQAMADAKADRARMHALLEDQRPKSIMQRLLGR